VNPGDPNLARVEVVAAALGDLCEELVFVGGCAANLLIDAPSAPPTRVTYDVDVIAEVAALSGYYALERRFAECGFAKDMSEGAPICRWRVGDVEVDLMPTDESILGFSNRWYPAAVASASSIALPSGRRISLISPPAFLATKFEAFHTRGRNDVLISHDLEDIVNVVEGRPMIVEEIAVAESGLRAYLAMKFRELTQNPEFANALPGLVAYDDLYQNRIQAVRDRASAIAGLDSL
jgi:predicted nucleotidyltransferase